MSDTFFAPFLFEHLTFTSRSVGSRGQGGSIPPGFVRSVNPISTRGDIMPTILLLAPRIFRPSYGPTILFGDTGSDIRH